MKYPVMFLIETPRGTSMTIHEFDSADALRAAIKEYGNWAADVPEERTILIDTILLFDPEKIKPRKPSSPIKLAGT